MYIIEANSYWLYSSFWYHYPQNEKKLRRVVSDFSTEINKLAKDFETIISLDEVMLAECECCGLKEEYTPDYIAKVKNSYSGKWLCGLCSEAVNEKLSRAPKTVLLEEAVNNQINICQEFNSTTRLNPKLSLTMKDILKRSCENRKKDSSNMKMSRSISCVPRIEVNPSKW